MGWTQADVEAFEAKRGKKKIVEKKAKTKIYAPAFEDTSELERETQTAIIKAIRQLGLLFYHVNNGANVGAVAGAIAQGQGVVEGVPDLVVAEPFEFLGVAYHALYIEVKRPKGGAVADAQTEWATALRNRGYWVISGIGGAGLVIDFLCDVYKPRIAVDLPKGCR